ncbi:MAG: TolC family protein [Flavobacteriales bacterium]
MMNYFSRIVFICAFHLLIQQAGIAQDSLVFSFDGYRSLVKSNHPYARQADLQTMRGESAVRRARGNFDPLISASFNNKEYQGNDYYALTNATIKIPTIAAVELKAGYDLNTGAYLNEADVTPDDGLFFTGLSLPLLQGLVVDERRTALRQAQAFQDFTTSEREILLNDLLLKAYNSYWEWWASYEKEKVAAQILSVSAQRFDAVKERALSGQAPIIDTVEAKIQVLLRQQFLQEAQANEIKARFMLSSFVWDATGEEVQPRIVNQKYFPSAWNMENAKPSWMMDNYLLLRDSLQWMNPYLKQYDAKLDNVEAEERMKREKLKPQLNLNYNLLAEPLGNNTDANFSSNNYKWGMELILPTLLRGERGDLQLTRIKMQELKWEQQQKTQEIKNRAQATYENIFLLQQQTTLADANVNNYLTLLDGERIKFFNGESSLFLVNQRELQYADAQNKLIELRLKLRMAENELAFLLGTIE